MAAVISLDARKAVNQSAAWEEYCAAARKAQDTLAIDDAIAAGRAWRRWLDLWMAPDQRRALDVARLPSERAR